MAALFPRMTMALVASGVFLVLAGAGPVAANPFGVERQGGDAIAAIRSLTPEQARELVAKRSDATVRIGTGNAPLAFAGNGISLRGALMLSSLASLDAETAAVLASYDEGPLFLDGLSTLSPEVARALKNFKGGPRSFASFGRCLSLAGLETLSDRAVAALAGFRGSALGLFVPRLSEESVRALATFSGDRLSLAGLVEPPAGLAELLPEFTCQNVSLHPWEWNLGRSRPVTTADARLLAAYVSRLGKTCVVPGITGLETPEAVEIATILAASRGSFSIPNLERISPRTLAALIRTGNVELPPIDVIDLIPDAEGGFTDDFVVPEDFPTRKRR